MSLPTYNSDLPFLIENWPGNPLAADGKFKNLYAKSERSFAELFRWQRSRNPQRAEKKADGWRIEVVDGSAFFDQKSDGLVWLGHATFAIRLGGKMLLTDPVLGNVGPVKRLAPLPVGAEKLVGFDHILLSHNHRDHADKASIQRILRQNPAAKVLTGLETGRRLLQQWAPKAAIEAAGWWQTFRAAEGLEIAFLPAMHWARRGPFDLNDMLWGAFLIRRKADGFTVFFGADSGYDRHFAEIGAAVGRIDLALLGIGAYAPRWFMRTSHTDPDEAVQAARDLGAKRLIPTHFGTFDLSDEPFGEPFSRILEWKKREPGLVKILRPGEFMAF